MDFTKSIDTEVGFLNFYFSRFYSVSGTSYHVLAFGRGKANTYFNMIKKDGDWVLKSSENKPEWLKRMERILALAILEYEKRS